MSDIRPRWHNWSRMSPNVRRARMAFDVTVSVAQLALGAVGCTVAIPLALVAIAVAGVAKAVDRGAEEVLGYWGDMLSRGWHAVVIKRAVWVKVLRTGANPWDVIKRERADDPPKACDGPAPLELDITDAPFTLDAEAMKAVNDVLVHWTRTPSRLDGFNLAQTYRVSPEQAHAIVGWLAEKGAGRLDREVYHECEDDCWPVSAESEIRTCSEGEYWICPSCGDEVPLVEVEVCEVPYLVLKTPVRLVGGPDE